MFIGMSISLVGKLRAGVSSYAIAGFTPPLVLDFENEYYQVDRLATTFDSAITHSRSGNATMVDSDGLLKWAPHNLLTYSEDVDASFATKQGVSVASGNNPAPDGSNTADRVEQDASTGFHRLAKTGFPANHANTFSAWLKAGEVTTVALAIFDGSTFTARVIFDLSAGVINTTQDGSGAITDAGNGWYLCEVFSSSGSASSTLYVYSGTTVTFQGVTGDGFYIWGVHVYRSDLGGMVDNPDRGDSYVPTTSAARYLARRGHHVYNGAEWVNEGMLHESEARTNLVTYSEDFTDASWGSARIDFISDEIGPDGVVNSATTITANTSNASGAWVGTSAISISPSTSYSASVFLKKNTGQFMLTLVDSSVNSNNVQQWFDTTTGSIGSQITNGVGWVFNTSTVEDLGNYWRISIVSENDGTASNATFRLYLTDSNGTLAVTSGASAVIYGAQLEAASTPSSYIPTSGATVTRAAETLTVPSANLPWPTPNVIGPELVTNGTFDTDVSGWTSIDTSAFSASGGQVTVINNGVAYGKAYQAISTEIGKVYKYQANTIGLSAGRLRIAVSNSVPVSGAFAFLAESSSAGVMLEAYFVASSTTTYIVFGNRNDTNASSTWDNISVREIDPLAVSIQMDGRMTYADEGTLNNVVFGYWVADGSNGIILGVDTNGADIGQFKAYQAASGVADRVETVPDYYSPGINVPFNIASRHGSTFVNGAVDGTALTADTTPTALPDLSTTDLSLGYDYMGTVRKFRVWAADIGDAGIAEASA